MQLTQTRYSRWWNFWQLAPRSAEATALQDQVGFGNSVSGERPLFLRLCQQDRAVNDIDEQLRSPLAKFLLGQLD